MATTDQLEQKLQRWVEASVIDTQAANRIRAFEEKEPAGTRWPVLLAIAFGAIMVAAGVLLFVAADWDELSPAQRFLLVLTMVTGFHLAAAVLTRRMRALGIALHGIGTVALGAGIFLAGQIFNLHEHWPGGILLWAIGAALAWSILRDWVQGALTAILVPAWLVSEWSVRTEHYSGVDALLVQFLVLLAITYLSAHRGEPETSFRRALTWIGGLVLLPSSVMLAFSGHAWTWRGIPTMPLWLCLIGYVVGFGLPLGLAWFLRQKGSLWNVGFALWAFVLGLLDLKVTMQNLEIFALCALGAIALVIWGMREQRRERINLGVAGFAITIIAFYFSTVMDKLGRSASLVGFGLLFLLGGWKLEQLRRQLVARTAGGK